MAVFTIYLGQKVLQAILTIFLNALTLVCVIRYKHLRSPADILIASIAACDIFYGISSCLFVISRIIIKSWLLQHALCLAEIAFKLPSVCIECVWLILLSLERWNSLQARLNKAKKWPDMRVYVLIFITWVVGLSAIVISTVSVDVKVGANCMAREYMPHNRQITVALLIVTFCITFIFYGQIAYTAYKSKQQVAIAVIPTSVQQQRKLDLQISKMMATVVGLFFILQIPFRILLAFISEESPQWQRTLLYCFTIIYDINFWINPMTYAWGHPKFKKVFRDMISHTFAWCPRLTNGPQNVGQPNPQDIPMAGPSGMQDTPRSVLTESTSRTSKIWERSPLEDNTNEPIVRTSIKSVGNVGHGALREKQDEPLPGTSGMQDTQRSVPAELTPSISKVWVISHGNINLNEEAEDSEGISEKPTGKEGCHTLLDQQDIPIPDTIGMQDTQRSIPAELIPSASKVWTISHVNVNLNEEPEDSERISEKPTGKEGHHTLLDQQDIPGTSGIQDNPRRIPTKLKSSTSVNQNEDSETGKDGHQT